MSDSITYGGRPSRVRRFDTAGRPFLPSGEIIYDKAYLLEQVHPAAEASIALVTSYVCRGRRRGKERHHHDRLRNFGIGWPAMLFIGAAACWACHGHLVCRVAGSGKLPVWRTLCAEGTAIA